MIQAFFYYRRTCIRYVKTLHGILKHVLQISISYAIDLYLICDRFASHMPEKLVYHVRKENKRR